MTIPLSRYWLHIYALAGMLIWAMPAFGQDHGHPPQDAQLHEQFYRDLRQPDNPGAGCCSNYDCYPTKAEFKRGSWWAVRREDKAWVRVPDRKVNTEPSPDGRAHLCSFAPSPATPNPEPFCFVPPNSGV